LMCDVQFVLEGNDDYSSYISTFEAAGCEAVISVSMPATAVPFFVQYRQVNPEIGIAGFGNCYDDSTLANGGKYVEGLAMPVAYFNNVDDPACKTFIDAFVAKAGRNPNTLDAQAYGAALMILEAVDKTGSIDRADIRDYIAKTTFTGIDGVTAFDETGAAIKGYYQVQVRDGAFVLIG
ncbi:MAG: ABC transporter substrate-binding protein, partial [Clostridiales bacterium]|nr:ABC transporter substrate-binding protein [Clostridiales bacterium]